MEKYYTVLIADDSAFTRRVISSYLLGTDFRVVASADNGQSALEQFKACSPDFVLLDVVMPGGSGLDVLKEIMKSNPSAKVIMVSSLGTENIVTECIGLGARSFVQKPFDRERLLSVLQKVLAC